MAISVDWIIICMPNWKVVTVQLRFQGFCCKEDIKTVHMISLLSSTNCHHTLLYSSPSWVLWYCKNYKVIINNVDQYCYFKVWIIGWVGLVTILTIGTFGLWWSFLIVMNGLCCLAG